MSDSSPRRMTYSEIGKYLETCLRADHKVSVETVDRAGTVRQLLCVTEDRVLWPVLDS